MVNIDFQSPAWHQVRKWAEGELEAARRKNDAMITPDQTSALRGEIRLLKRFLDLPATSTREVVVEPDE